MSLLQFHNSKVQGLFAIVNELTFIEMVGVRFPAIEKLSLSTSTTILCLKHWAHWF